MPYADYIYYAGTYRGKMSESDYEGLSRRASAHLDRLTQGRINDEWTADDRVKDACCAISDILLKEEQGGEVTSETAGRWSRNFATSGKSAAKRIREAASLYLSETGLMYRGVNA